MEQYSQERLDAEVIQDGKFKGNYLQWLKMQFRQLDRVAWLIYGLGFGFQLSLLIAGKIDTMAVLAFLGIATGFLTTVLMSAKGWQKTLEPDGVVREHLVSGRSINGAMGALSVVFYIIVNYQAGHYFSVVNQLIFFFAIDLAMIIKWRTWGHGEDEATKHANAKTWVYIILGILVAWALLYPIGMHLHDSQPLTDSLVLAFGAVASVLYVKRNSASYLVFITSNVINIILWAGALDKGLSPASLAMLVMTIMYMVSSAYGFYNMHFVRQGQVREEPKIIK